MGFVENLGGAAYQGWKFHCPLPSPLPMFEFEVSLSRAIGRL